MEWLLIPLMAFVARAAGGGIKLPSIAGWIPEFLFSLVICLVSLTIYSPWIAVPLSALSYLGFQTGHATAYHMGRKPQAAQGLRKHTLSKIVDPICHWLGLTLGERPYCYFFMGIKGLLIGLAVAPLGLIMAILWPLAYDIGRIRNNEAAEFLSGAFMGLILCLILLL